MPDNTLIDRILHHRQVAERNGDRNLVRECDLTLARHGYRPGASNEGAEARAEADARPTRRPTVRRDA